MRRDAAAPLAGILACLAALLACLAAPWLLAQVGGGKPVQVGLSSLVGGIAYERALALWPLAALPVAALSLAAALLAPLWPRAPQVQATAWLAAAAAALVVAVTGTRWVGFQAARLLDPGPVLVTLGAAPVANLLAGLGVAALGLRRLQARLPAPAWDRWGAPLACAATLLASPLIPLGAAQGAFPLRYDELTLAAAEAGLLPLQEAAWRLMAVRALLWAVVAAGAASALAAIWAPQRRWTQWTTLLPAPFVLAAAVATGWFEWAWLQAPGVASRWNLALPVGVAAALVLQTLSAASWLRAPGRPA